MLVLILFLLWFVLRFDLILLLQILIHFCGRQNLLGRVKTSAIILFLVLSGDKLLQWAAVSFVKGVEDILSECVALM